MLWMRRRRPWTFGIFWHEASSGRPVVRYRPVFLMGPWATYWMYEGLHGNLMGHLLDGKKQANLSDSVGFNGLRKPHNIYLQQQCPPCKPERNPGTCGSGSWVNLGLSGDCTHKQGKNNDYLNRDNGIVEYKLKLYRMALQQVDVAVENPQA